MLWRNPITANKKEGANKKNKTIDMKEQLITFETAKLAKEKGFASMKANCYGDNMCYQLPEGYLINALKGNIVSGYILAPTQSLLQKWLRDKYQMTMNIHPVKDGKWEFIIFLLNEPLPERGYKNKMSLYVEPYRWNTYEETLEIGLQEALKLIKK